MMGRPTVKRRLRDIDPEAFGQIVAARVEAHVTLLLDPEYRHEDVKHVVVRHVHVVNVEATRLARFARDGSDAQRATSALFAVRVWLYSCAMHSAHSVIAGITVAPNDDIGVVLLAAHARIRLSQNESVPVRELACLAGVDSDHVRLLGRQGEIEIANGTVASSVAVRWLTARGIPLPFTDATDAAVQ